MIKMDKTTTYIFKLILPPINQDGEKRLTSLMHGYANGCGLCCHHRWPSMGMGTHSVLLLFYYFHWAIKLSNLLAESLE